ncbi:MAG: arsenate reductase ArsC [Bacteriovoracia bacterium]
MKTILFLCVRNSARSQIAEGLAKKILGPSFRILSAGSNPGEVNPYAIRVLDELGIDISHHHSKSVTEIDPATVDLIITLCDEEICPVFPSGVKRLSWSLPDPVIERASDQVLLACFRETRDNIGKRLQELKNQFLEKDL